MAGRRTFAKIGSSLTAFGIAVLLLSFVGSGATDRRPGWLIIGIAAAVVGSVIWFVGARQHNGPAGPLRRWP